MDVAIVRGRAVGHMPGRFCAPGNKGDAVAFGPWQLTFAPESRMCRLSCLLAPRQSQAPRGAAP